MVEHAGEGLPGLPAVKNMSSLIRSAEIKLHENF